MHQQREEALARGLERIGRAFETGGPGVDRSSCPVGEGDRRRIEGRIDRRGAREGRGRRERGAGRGLIASQDGAERIQRGGATEIESARIGARIAIERRRRGDARVGEGGAGPGELRFDHRERVAHDLLERHVLVHEPVHERGVGAVLEQAPHQVGQQVRMRSDGRIGAYGREIFEAASRLVVQQAAHAVQPLELERGALGTHRQHGADAVRVVGRELRVDERTRGEQASRAAEP